MSRDIAEALENLAREKDLSKEMLVETLKAALISAYKKNYSNGTSVEVEFNDETGELKVYSILKVIDDTDDLDAEIGEEEIVLEDALTIKPDAVVGDIIREEVTPSDFGRIATLTAKQVIVQRIKEAERRKIIDTYTNKIGDIVTGRVQRISRGDVYVELGDTIAKLAKEDQIPGEFFKTYRQGKQNIKFYVQSVKDPNAEVHNQAGEVAASDEPKKKKKEKNILIQLSRKHPNLVTRLFELEVPEVYDGTVEIKSIARDAGNRTKIAVLAKADNIDAVGACVGQKGIRVGAIVNELSGENIDIIPYSDIPEKYIANALSPAKTIKVDLDEEAKSAIVYVSEQQINLAIGREAKNVELAAKLTGWSITIKTLEGLDVNDSVLESVVEEDSDNKSDCSEEVGETVDE